MKQFIKKHERCILGTLSGFDRVRFRGTIRSCDVMRFLGRVRRPEQNQVQGKFKGQVTSDLKRRPEGLRVKHRLNRNSIKMYTSAGGFVARCQAPRGNRVSIAAYPSRSSSGCRWPDSPASRTGQTSRHR